MGRPGITSEQVHEAADALVADGVAPTVVRIRTRLGGGSPNNISKWLNQWREARTELEREASPPMPTPVETAMSGVWVAAWRAAHEQMEGEREAMARARKEIERERTEMLAEINRLDDELEAAKSGFQEMREVLDAERHEHESTRADVKEARGIASERKARIEQQAIELQEAQRQAADATAQAGRVQALEVERDRALADKDRLAADLKREQETARQAKAAIDAGAVKIRKLEETLETERRARQSADQAMTELRVQVATLTERAARTDELRALARRDAATCTTKGEELSMRTCYLNLRARGPNPDRDEILEIALLDDAGAIMLDSPVHPSLQTIWPDAWRVARIAPEDVANAPLINELRPRIAEAVWDARVVIYNAADQAPLLREVLAHAGEVQCAMCAFASAPGACEARRDAVQCPPLGVASAHVGHVWTGRPRRALAACRATRAVWRWTNDQATPVPTASAVPRMHRPER